MKKIVLFMFFMLGAGTYSADQMNDTQEINNVIKKLNKEFIIFYGGYDTIFDDGIDEKNIDFLMKEIQSGTIQKVQYDFEKLKNHTTIKVPLDSSIEFTKTYKLKSLKEIGKTHKRSKITYSKKHGTLEMIFSSVGKYTVSFTEKDLKKKTTKTKIITFIKSGEYQPKDKIIEKNIENSYSDKNQDFLNKNLQLLRIYYPDSEEIQKGLLYAVEVNEANKNFLAVRDISQELVTNYSLAPDTKDKIIASYLNALDQLGEEEAYLNFLSRLALYDDEYKMKYLNESMRLESYTPESINIANEESKVSADPIVFEYLGDYYFHRKNYRVAIINYKKADKKSKLARVYLISGDKLNLIKLKKEATNTEKDEIAQVEKEYLAQKELDRHIRTAEILIKKGRLREAELYYKKALQKDLTPNLKTDIHYKLSELYYKLDEFDNAKEELKKVKIDGLEEKYLGGYYYLSGMTYYKLKKYPEGAHYFGILIEKFPNTPLSHRGRIYLLKINKLENEKK